jgi:hypothetical protein
LAVLRPWVTLPRKFLVPIHWHKSDLFVQNPSFSKCYSLNTTENIWPSLVSGSMTKRRRLNTLPGLPQGMAQTTDLRYRNSSAHHGIPEGTKEINAAPMLAHAGSPGPRVEKMTIPRIIVTAGEVTYSTLPALLSWSLIMSLIFSGCCSNVRSYVQTTFSF